MIPPDMLQEQHSEDMFRLGNSEGMFRRCGGSLFPFARAGLTWWINIGLVEGHVTKLKLIKRHGYGRAGFPPAAGNCFLVAAPLHSAKKKRPVCTTAAIVP